jgi:serine/threonine-protein kinase
MSPEQAQALPELDHRADVWSMAAIAYEGLTGSIPFKGSTGPAILLAILSHEPVPPSEAGTAHGVPATLDPVMEEALAKNAGIRVPTMGALVDRIGQAYGLTGSHAEWARTSQDALGAQIKAALPATLARYEEQKKASPNLKGMDDAFRAGSEGGPSGGAFSEDMVMGVPSGPP